MDAQYPAIYQSGQEVFADGWYEAVGAKTPTVAQLTSGQTFPNYDGRAICWYHIRSKSFSSEPFERPEKLYDDSELIYGGMYS